MAPYWLTFQISKLHSNLKCIPGLCQLKKRVLLFPPASAFTRSFPPLVWGVTGPPKVGQFACRPHTRPIASFNHAKQVHIIFQTAWLFMTYAAYVCLKCVRWGRGKGATGHPGTLMHHFDREMALSQTCSNPAAFQDLSHTCLRIWCSKVGSRGREIVFLGWPCRDQVWVRTQKMRYPCNPYMLSIQTKPGGRGQA